MAGINFADVSDPRKVNLVGFDPTQDTRHWGMSLNTTYKTDYLNVQYIGAYRSLHYISDHPSGGRDYAFPGGRCHLHRARRFCAAGHSRGPAIPDGAGYTATTARWTGTRTSKNHTHELRFTSPDSAARLTWAAGLYYFRSTRRIPRHSAGLQHEYSVPGIQPGKYQWRVEVGLRRYDLCRDPTSGRSPAVPVTRMRARTATASTSSRVSTQWCCGAYRHAGIQLHRTVTRVAQSRCQRRRSSKHAGGRGRALPRGHCVLRHQ